MAPGKLRPFANPANSMPKLPVGLLVFALPALLPAQESTWRALGVEKIKLADEVVWRAVATETAPNENAAREAAERAARRMLAESAKSRIETDLLQVVRERDGGGKTGSETEIKSVLRATTDVELRRARTVRLDARPQRDAFLGYAEVEILEGDLIPTTRLRAAITKEGTQALLELADQLEAEPLEAESLWALAEQALQVARDRDGGLALQLRLGQHHEKRGNLGKATSWFRAVVAGGNAEDGDADKVIVASARARLAAIRERVPTVAALVQDLRQLSESRRQPSRLSARVRLEDGKTKVDIDSGKKDETESRRILCTWIEAALTLNWPATGAQPIIGNVSLPLEWQPTTGPARVPARLILWSLPVDHPLWADLELEADRAWPLTGDVDVLERDRLRGLIAKLRASDAPAWVVAMDR